MKYFITLILLLSLGTVMGQVADSANTQGGLYDIYYNLETTDQSSSKVSDWEIGFTVHSMDASIMINEGDGVELYLYSNDTSDWNSVDTSGFDFENGRLLNSEESWTFGAFSNQNTVHPDYGWGMYNSDNHDINGSRLFILKRGDGSYAQVVINKMSAAGLYNIRIGDLGGSNTSITSIDKSSYNGKNFVYLNTVIRQVLDLEPQHKWHLLFTKYVTPIQAGPNLLLYAVAGVKINKDMMVAERAGVAITSNDTSGLSWSDNITEVGYDWKTFNNSTMQYDLLADHCYFVKSKSGEVWKLWFTKYVGGPSGTFYFNVQSLSQTNGFQTQYLHDINLYPNPTNGTIFIHSSNQGEYTCEIITSTGAVIFKQQLTGGLTQSFDLSPYKPGMYFVIMSTQLERRLMKLIIE